MLEVHAFFHLLPPFFYEIPLEPAKCHLFYETFFDSLPRKVDQPVLWVSAISLSTTEFVVS